MARGKLRIHLGAAPGVGKTYPMPSGAHRRIKRGTDCVAAHTDVPGSRNAKRWRDAEDQVTSLRSADVEEVVPVALGGVPDGSGGPDVPETLPIGGVDPGLLERAMADLVPDEAKERIFEPFQRYGDAPRPEDDNVAEHPAEPERQASS